MSDTTFDPKTIFETYRNAFAPALKAQQEGVKALDRVGRYQYAVAGDYLEWSLAQAKAALSAQIARRFRLQAGGTDHGAQREAARARAGVRQRWPPTRRRASADVGERDGGEGRRRDEEEGGLRARGFRAGRREVPRVFSADSCKLIRTTYRFGGG